MKKTILISALLPALMLVSCNKSIEETPSLPQEVVAHFHAVSPDTKTVFGAKNSESKYPVLWSANDTQVGYVLTSVGSIKSADLIPATDGKSAEITASLDAADSYQFVFASPYASFKSANKTNKTILLEIPTVQESTPDGPDEAAQLLYAVTDELKSLEDEVPVTFSHAAAYLHIFFSNVTIPSGATLNSVTVEAPEGCYIAGRNQFLPESGTYNGDGTSRFNIVTVSTQTVDEIWCGIVPVDFSGKTLKLIINTDKGTLTKSIALPTSAALSRGDVVKFTVDMSGISMVDPVEYQLVTSESELHWGDRIIIAAADSDVAIGNGQNTNNRSQVGVSKVNDGASILDPSSSVEIIQLEDGLIPGTYALKATVNAGYLYAAAGNDDAGNYLRTQDALDASGSWEISFGDQTPNDQADPDSERAIVKAKVPYRNLLRYNSASSLFSAYALTTSMQPIKIYRLKGDPDTTPRFKVTNDANSLEDVNVSYSGGAVSVYVFGNVSWTASVTGAATLDVTSGEGPAILTLTVPENTVAEAKTYTVTVSTSESVETGSYSFNIQQTAAPAGDIVLVYSMTPNGNEGSQNTYAGNCDVVMGTITWNVTGNSMPGEDYGYWRIGGKNLNGVSRGLYSKTALPNEVFKLVVSHGTVGITVNSITLTVHKTADDAASGDNAIATLTGTVTANSTTTFEKEDSTSWAGCYYRIMYNMTNTTKNNKNLQFKGLEIWGYAIS